jgi:uncharacterized protein (TIGR02231 family)
MSSLLLILLSAAPGPSKVVVFPDRAQVTRVAAIACGTRVAVHFEGIPPAADLSSLRAQSINAKVEGMQAEARSRAQAFSSEVRALDDDIQKRQMDISAMVDGVARADEQARVAGSYGEVTVGLLNREMSEAGPNPKNWGQAMDAVLQTRLKAVAAKSQMQAKLREAQRALEDVQRRRNQLTAAANRREGVANVVVSCPAGQQAQVELTYLVGGVSWSPAYEARADEASATVELSTYATLEQRTGENWSQARVTLSTALPVQNATPPELAPLKVWAEERSEQKKVLVRRDEYQEHAESSVSTPASSAGKPGLRPVPQGLSVQLTVPETADVPGDGTPVRVFVGRSAIKARFAFRAYPKQMPFVYRVADLANETPFPLLPGRLDAFRRSGLVAHYPLERVAQGATMHLSFGIEDSLRVKRTIVEEVVRETGLFGGNRRFRYGYKLELANYGKREEVVELAEHVPVSELDDVKVQVDAKTTPGYELKPEDGVLTWKQPLRPADKRTLELAFHVDVPSSYE